MNHFLMCIGLGTEAPPSHLLLVPSSPGSTSCSHPPVSDSHLLQGDERGSLCACINNRNDISLS